MLATIDRTKIDSMRAGVAHEGDRALTKLYAAGERAYLYT